jgi:hypothetical protein
MPLPRLAAMLFAAVPLMTAVATDHPVRVTTDSSAYCLELASRFAGQQGERDSAALALADEGRKLCETGYVRTGIAKLRRALRTLQTVGG